MKNVIRGTLEATHIFPQKTLLFIKQNRFAIYHIFYSAPRCSRGMSGETEKNKMMVTFS